MGSPYRGLLTPQQTCILELLSARFGLRSDEIAKALYEEKAPPGAKNTIAVQLHRIRRVLEPYGVEISPTNTLVSVPAAIGTRSH